MNIAMLLEMVADGAADRVVIGSRNDGITAVSLLDRADRGAAVLAARGARYLAFVGQNSEVVPVALFAAARAGVPFAPVNYRLPDEQLQGVLRRLVPGLAVVDPEVQSRIGAIENLDVMTVPEFMAEIEATPAAAQLEYVDPEEIAVLLFTSGTTGEPKAAVLRHRHLTSYIIGSVEYLAADEDEAQLVSVPPYHVAGVSSILSSLYSGRRIVYLPGFDPDDWVRMVADEGVTQAMVVPTMLGRILSRIEETGADVSGLRHISYGGGRMPMEVIERAMKLLPDVNFVNAYGLTETSSTISVLTPEDHRRAAGSSDPNGRRRLGSVGRPLGSVEVQVRDPDGRALGPGERGEVCVRGEQVAGEYLGRSALAAEGWFPTRDAGWLDEEGYLFLEGRIDDVIVRGAENLSPGEIEDTLLSHPSVAEAAVVGIPDREWGEAVAAAVVLEPGADLSADELKEWVRSRLRSTKTPTVIDFRDELPYNETGKLLRRVVRDELGGAESGDSE